MALEHEIEQLGRRMGIANLALSAEGMMAFDVDGMGRVFLDLKSGELLVYLARSVPSHDRGMAGRILAVCHYRNAHPVPLSGGVHNGLAILLTRMAERRVSTAFLENTVNYLAQQMNTVFRA